MPKLNLAAIDFIIEMATYRFRYGPDTYKVQSPSVDEPTPRANTSANAVRYVVERFMPELLKDKAMMSNLEIDLRHGYRFSRRLNDRRQAMIGVVQDTTIDY
jgi:hypothetical protein